MSKARDPGREIIERNNSAPAISVDWSASSEDLIRGKGDTFGRVDWFRAIPDYVRRRRSKEMSTSGMHEACEIVLAFLKYYTGPASNPANFIDRQQFTHTILGDMGAWQERRTGRINALAQAVLREAADGAHRKERLGW